MNGDERGLDHLSGPVDVCVAVPRLALDRPFTYLLPEDAEAGTGSLVSVPFHGRTVKGWILGPAEHEPAGPLLEIGKVRSPVRFFRPSMLALLRWVRERYVAPLAVVIERSHPPRVAAEEGGPATAPSADWTGDGAPSSRRPGPLERYGGPALLEPGTATWLRPLPKDEAAVCVDAVRRTVEAGRTAIVLVPEAEPVPYAARAVLEGLGERAVSFLGGQARSRYRTWLDVASGAYDVVVSTRPGVFAPLRNLGLIWISRDAHPGHREERAPYHHIREVALARSRLEHAAAVIAALSPSVDVASLVESGSIRAARAQRQAERNAAPLVETAPSEAHDHSVRLAAMLRTARSAALILSRRGYGVARVCRSCGHPATCATCGGPVAVEGGRTACRTCGSPGRCANCGGTSFGIERGGTESVAEWTARQTDLPISLEREGEDPPVPGPGRLVVGTAATVRDLGPIELGLVGILDPDRALARPGIRAAEQAVATWMEAAAWAGPRAGRGRVLAQSRQPGHPAVQALVRWDPVPFLAQEARRRTEAGFPPAHPVFRVEGSPELEPALAALSPVSLLATAVEGGTVCLVAVRPERLPALREAILRLSSEGTVERVEAEPQL
jgi:primosomal protein N' (replication factor Y)